MRDHVIICGLGRIGANVARELMVTHHDFVAVELDASAVERFRQDSGERTAYVRILHSDTSADDTLQAAGIKQVRGVFAVTSEDGHNMLIVLTAKQLNPAARVVARVHDVRND